MNRVCCVCSTVLQAFRQVADVLAALHSDAATLAAQTRAESAAAQSLNLVVQNLKLGSVSGLDLIQAEHDHEMAVLGLVQARAARLADTVALYQALGGSWLPPGVGAGGVGANANVIR